MPNGIFSLKQQLQGLIQKAWTGSQTTPAVEYLVVAGGGGSGGASYDGSGGGAGGLLQGVIPVIAGVSTTVTIGGGGAASSSTGTTATAGQNSVFGNITANGGGYGVSWTNSSTAGLNGGSGGSGGGGGATDSSKAGIGGSNIFNQGNIGGSGYAGAGVNAGGGGGGVGTSGGNAISNTGGNGGAGIASYISGTLTAYAGGGAGGSGGTGGVGGIGGGGNGGSNGTSGTAGSANTGGGAGGGSYNGGSGASGGSGIVIISYPDTYNAPSALTGTYTASTSGSGSLSFNGSSQYITTVQQSNLGSGNYTTELWLYNNGSGSNQAIFDFRTAAGSYPVLYIDTSYKLNWVGNNNNLLGTSTSAISLNTWTHIAVVRNGSTNTFYINGVASGTFSDLTSYNGNYITIGASGFSGDSHAAKLNGNISNMRFVVGTAVYTSNFTPPSAPLTPITNTTLLLNTTSYAYLVDSSSSALTFTNTGSIAWSASSPFATGLGFRNRVYTWTGSGTVTF